MSWTPAEVVRRRAAEDADAVLLSEPERSWTAGELDLASSRVAQGLLDGGCHVGDRVAFLDGTSSTYYEILLGASKIGAVAVAVNWRLSVEEMEYVVRDAGARVLFAGADFADQAGIICDRIGPSLALQPLDRTYDGWRDAHPPDDPGHRGQDDDIAVQIYTSGTTGESKGVLLTNRAIEASLAHVANYGLVEGATALVSLPQFHFGGTVWPLWAWSVGASCLLHTSFDPELVVKQARDTISCLITVPSMLRQMCDAADIDPSTYPALQVIGYGSAPITESLLARALTTFDCAFVQTYGSTETCGIATQLSPDDHARADLLRSAGRPVAGVDVLIGDARTGERRPAGEVGDIWIRSPMNMLGYWNKPELTAEVRTEDGWVRTGDLGYLESDGYLFLADRANEMIITGGENVYPAQVENILAGHPDVHEVAVVGVADDRWGELVTAVVVRTEGSAVIADELIAYARARIAHYKAPRSVVFVDDELPKSAMGKVLRREVRDALSPTRFA